MLKDVYFNQTTLLFFFKVSVFNYIWCFIFLKLICRGCSWDSAIALYEQAKAEEASASAPSFQPTDSTSSGTRKASMTGFYMTRNSYQGKYFVTLAIEKNIGVSKSGNMIIVRPSTGRNEMQKLVRISYMD